ncbi:MAG TPA: gliding motility protein GldM [Lacibacter sp.]|nr:gliding motility protein GldM [Lacibacter sp.]HMO88710.1 gliding motility protein GldM [Lacibacter sp.]HMP86770.1 gliding motility protein GldM [Lacibacter sp.]
MALPKEPRQKMINLMYLVLTALLALNVSAEIINAFKVVDNSLSATSRVVNASTETIMSSFKEKLADPATREKAEVWMPKAEAAVRLTKEMSDMIDGLKDKIKKEAGFDPANPAGGFKEDNIDIATRIMDKQGEGEKLRKKLEEYKAAILALDPEVGRQFANSLPIDLTIPKSTTTKLAKVTWTSAYFNMTPTVAALTMLSKFQNDVKTTENRMVNEFHNRVGQVVVRFDTYAPIVGANSTYLFPGQELQITAGIGAFSKNVLPQVTIGGKSVPMNADGLAVFKTAVGNTGGTVPVIIRYKDQDGNDQVRETKIEYTVGTPTGAFVSAEKVKVLYIGLENELAVTGGSVGDEKVTVSISNGTLRKTGPGKYIASPTNTGAAVVTVNADGKTAQFNFRVKTVPDPTPMVGASTGGRMPANVFKAQQGIRADLKDFVFEGVTFTVTGYTFYATGAGFQEAPGVRAGIRGNTFAPVEDLLNRCRPGTTIVLDEIKAVGPGGNTRNLPTMAFNLY